MAILIVSLFIFAAAFVSHIAVWRVIRVPKPGAGLALLVLIGALPLGLLIVTRVFGIQFRPWQILQITEFHVAISVAYAIAYCGIEETSPTLAIIRAVHKTEPEGCTQIDLEQTISGITVFAARLKTLQSTSLAAQNNEDWHLTRRGLGVARTVRFIATSLRLPKGG